MSIEKFEAAKRGLSIVGTMKGGEFKAKHTKRIMINMNRLRPLAMAEERRINAMIASWFTPQEVAGVAEVEVIEKRILEKV